jgi:hypothetical protein
VVEAAVDMAAASVEVADTSAVVASMAAALIAAVFALQASAAEASAAVGDPYNQPVYQGSAGYTDQLVGQIQLRLARTGY